MAQVGTIDERELQIVEAAQETYSGAQANHLPMRVGFSTGAKWADEHPRKGLIEVEKVIEYLRKNHHVMNKDIMIGQFKRELLGEE